MSAITNNQRLEALQSANGVRFRRSALRRELESLPGGRDDAWIRASLMLVNEPDRFQDMPVHVFLTSVPFYGPEKMRRTCQRLRLWPFRTIGELTDNQRLRLSQEIRRDWRG